MEDGTDWYSPDMATFGDRLAGAREAARMTQKDLAKRLGVRTATLRSWEDDLNEPRANRLSMLAGLLNVSVTWLINGQGDGMIEPTEAELEDTSLLSLIGELRDLRADLQSRTEQVARLEKRLRQAMAARADG